jgi:hypothetical protein
MAGIIGLYGNHFTVMEFTQKYMKDLTHVPTIFCSRCCLEVLAMVDKAGGIDYILYQIKDKIARSQHKWN